MNAIFLQGCIKLITFDSKDIYLNKQINNQSILKKVSLFPKSIKKHKFFQHW